MNWIKQIYTAFKGSINQAGESVADATAITRFEQELREAREAIRQAERSLTAAKADEIGLKRRVEDLKGKVDLRRGQARQLLAQGNEALATEVAGEIAKLQSDLAAEEAALAHTAGLVTDLNQQILEGRRSIETMERELNIVKTTEAVNRASADAQDHLVGIDSKGSAAMESLKRIKERQAHHKDRISAARELGRERHGASLDEKIQAAGIGVSGNSAQDILAELKAEAAVETVAKQD